MGRWEPNARGRLEEAALDLYGERGYEKTTVAEIAARAGLTERTFFRHYADKREVLFAGSSLLQDVLTKAVADAPDGASPLDATAAALDAVSAIFAGRRAHARRRQAVINANTELRERELIKLATLASTLADALRRRGVPDPTAPLTAETGIAVFKVAFDRWLTTPTDQELAEILRESLATLKTVTAA
ncbi:TetR family transcriptional regulator [Actinomadura sp. NPDC000600]|uniref:TetR/AcrR family transcriptional regulator n=1 Tax=Actinomadura sp. NPDC000600 TaxID=3154262 RepID=UPI00339814BD